MKQETQEVLKFIAAFLSQLDENGDWESQTDVNIQDDHDEIFFQLQLTVNKETSSNAPAKS